MRLSPFTTTWFSLSFLEWFLRLLHLRFSRYAQLFCHLVAKYTHPKSTQNMFCYHQNLMLYVLWQTYGIPSISSLLIATGQISTESRTGTKRMADTGALLLEAVLNPPASIRAITAIARINYIHDRHRRRGRISDADMLYTLSLFALEPSRWVSRFDWRKMTELELCALGVLWKSIGEAMEIPYDLLPSSRSGWRNGLEWLNELSEWSSIYEEKYMVPATSNKRLADSTIDRMLWKLPVNMKGIGRNVVAALLEDKLREAML